MRSIQPFGRLLAVVAALLIVSCAQPEPAPDTQDNPINEEANGAFNDLYDQFGEGEFGPDSKSDAFWEHLDPCAVLGGIYEFADDFTQLGFFYGVEGEGVLGTAVGVGGYDVVFDLYHRQMTVSKYAGAGVGTPGLGVSLTVYAGVALGFHHGVSDWDGYFVTTELELGLPLLKDFIHLEPGFFVTGVDANDDNFIEPSEVLVPPEGVYGFSVGLSVGVDALPDVLPVGATLTEGLWMPHKRGIRTFYDQLKDESIMWFYDLNVHLVDHSTGEACPSDWPDVEGERDCILEFGDEGMSNTKASLHLAWAMCTLNGGCLSPIAGSMALTAVAIGAFRDAGDRLDEICPDLASGGEH